MIDKEIISSLDNSLEENTDNLESYGLEDITNKIIINNNESINIKLKTPNEAYYEIYKLAKQQGRKHKKAAISAYLEAKQIKNTYILDDLDDDSDSSTDEYDSESEKVKNEINEIVEQL
jgi:ribosomal protein L11